MVETRVTLEPEVQEIFEEIDKGENFLLSGGAGSGKTYSLIQVIGQVISENPTANIACITYTNAAVREIDSRFNNKNLIVSTIHDFLWDNIKSFQTELKRSLVKLINDEDVKAFSIPEEVATNDYFKDHDIQYKEYISIRQGIISHDEVLVLANHMFEEYSKLCDVMMDKFKFIFIDEYQDTSSLVVQILLDYLRRSDRQNTIGFFGDAMQSIYDDGVGDLDGYIASGRVQEIKKQQNRRNPKRIYELANKLRTDGIVQVASSDSAAPNMQDGEVKDGNIRFFYSTDAEKLDDLKQLLDWDFSESRDTKELNLTHNLIAPKAGFKNLMAIYDGDKILDYRDRIKRYIKDNKIDEDLSTLTFGQVIDKLLEGKTSDAQKRPVLPTPGMQSFIDDNLALYEKCKNYPYDTFARLYVNKDGLLDDKKADEDDESKASSQRDNLIRHLFKIQTNIHLYESGNYNEFLRKTEFKMVSIEDKVLLQEIINQLKGMSENTIEEVIEYADEKGICRIDDNLLEFIAKKGYLYDQLKELKFQEFQNLFWYLEGYTPFSTQHKIKGTQFSNVLVILDNGNWNKYNFEYLLNEGIFSSLSAARKKSFPTILRRTQKLFYVCCTRAKDNLVVYFHNPSQAILETAREWFGAENTLEIGSGSV